MFFFLSKQKIVLILQVFSSLAYSNASVRYPSEISPGKKLSRFSGEASFISYNVRLLIAIALIYDLKRDAEPKGTLPLVRFRNGMRLHTRGLPLLAGEHKRDESDGPRRPTRSIRITG